MRGERLALFLRGERHAHGLRGTALHNALIEQSLSRGHRHQRQDLRTTAGLPEQRHVVRIAAERFDIVPNPLQRIHDVQQTHIARSCVFLTVCGQIQMAEHIETMVHRNHHHVLAFAQIRAVVVAFVGGPRGEAAAVQPHHNRTVAVVVDVRGPDVQILAVIVGSGVIGRCRAAEHGTLRRCGAIRVRLEDAVPWFHVMRRFEPFVRRGVRDAEIPEDAVLSGASNVAVCGPHFGISGYGQVPECGTGGERPPEDQHDGNGDDDESGEDRPDDHR